MKKQILEASILKRKSYNNAENLAPNGKVLHKKSKHDPRVPLSIISSKLKHLPSILKRRKADQLKQAQPTEQQPQHQQHQPITLPLTLPTTNHQENPEPALQDREHAVVNDPVSGSAHTSHHAIASLSKFISPVSDFHHHLEQTSGIHEYVEHIDDPIEDFRASYSMISSSSFYESAPFEEVVDDERDDVEDMKYFGLDLKKHARLLRRRETAYLPKSNYMKWQPLITPKMRMILLHWMSEICEEFSLQRETWHIAVNCVDRFLSCMPKIARCKLQLIGIAGLLVACKMEEYQWPSVVIMEQLCDGACTQDQILQMEKLMLQKIGWLLLPVTPYIFLRLYLLILLKSKHTTQNNNNNNNNNDSNLTNNINSNNSFNSSLDNSSDSNNFDENYAITRICKGNFRDLEVEFPIREFTKMMQIIDIAMMDYTCLNYTPSLLAASVLHLVYVQDETLIFELTKYQKNELSGCLEWLRPFSGVPMPKSYDFTETPFQYCLQNSNANAKAFLENFLSKSP